MGLLVSSCTTVILRVKSGSSCFNTQPLGWERQWESQSVCQSVKPRWAWTSRDWCWWWSSTWWCWAPASGPPWSPGKCRAKARLTGQRLFCWETGGSAWWWESSLWQVSVQGTMWNCGEVTKMLYRWFDLVFKLKPVSHLATNFNFLTFIFSHYINNCKVQTKQ